MRPLKNLIFLNISQNPFDKTDHCRLFVIYNLPTLIKLNDSNVLDIERQNSLRFNREEVETLEAQLSKLNLDLKNANDELVKFRQEVNQNDTNEKKTFNSISTLKKRISFLEEENRAQKQLLNKKSEELVGLSQLLYQMKQELAL